MRGKKITEVITKEVIRGHFRDWIVNKTKTLRKKHVFTFDMESMAIGGYSITAAQKATSLSDPEFIEVIFFVDNIMREFLYTFNNQYVIANRTNMRALKRKFNYIWRGLNL